MGNFFLGGFSDISSGFSVTAQNVPAAEVQMILAYFASAVSFVITLVSTAALYWIPAVYIVKGLINTVPFVDKFLNSSGANSGGFGGGGGGSRGGIIGYIGDTWKELLVSLLFALNGASGFWATEVAMLSDGVAALIQKLSNASFSTTDNPASIKQFKGLVKNYSTSDIATMYETYLAKEQNANQALQQYAKTNSPDSTDMKFQRMKASYTAIVCREQILSDRLQKDNYAAASGISDPNYYKRHLQTDSATSNTSAAFNPNFVVDSMVQAFGTTLPQGSN